MICAIEVARILKEEGFVPKRNFVVVGFCDEEGMRFGTGYFGSGAMLGHRDVEYTKKFADTDGVTIYDAMKGYGLDPEKIGEAAWKEGSIGQFLEAHIEQGPVLTQKAQNLAGRRYRWNSEIHGNRSRKSGPCGNHTDGYENGRG